MDVWFNRSPVGVLEHVNAKFIGDQIRFSILDKVDLRVTASAELDVNALADVVEYEFHLARRTRLVSNHDIERMQFLFGSTDNMDVVRERYSIPDYAAAKHAPENDSVLFIWKVIELKDLDEYEKIFDLDAFIPK